MPKRHGTARQTDQRQMQYTRNTYVKTREGDKTNNNGWAGTCQTLGRTRDKKETRLDKQH